MNTGVLLLLTAASACAAGCGPSHEPKIHAQVPATNTPSGSAPAERSVLAPGPCGDAADVRDGVLAEELIRRVNVLRQAGTGCGPLGARPAATPLEKSTALTCAARLQARDMSERGFFSHRNPDGLGSADRARRAGFVGASGESLAWGQATAEDVVTSWQRSPEHCRNMLNPRWQWTGTAHYVAATGRTFWVQTFGTR